MNIHYANFSTQPQNTDETKRCVIAILIIARSTTPSQAVIPHIYFNTNTFTNSVVGNKERRRIFGKIPLKFK